MSGTSFLFANFYGTRWPVPQHWKQTSEDNFVGEDGVLKLKAFEGALLDPARCRAAADERPGSWSLTRSINGTGLVGQYQRNGALVLAHSVRSLPPDAVDWLLPEVQASYVFAPVAASIADEVSSALRVTRLNETAFGILDQYGHGAMGPLPVHGSWTPVGESPGSQAFTPGEKAAFLTYVGGGVVTFADSPQSCGILLAPLPWISLSYEVAADAVQLSLPKADIHFSREKAVVFGQVLSDEGLSYEAFDKEERSRIVGAVWTDAFDQPWHLRYWFSGAHAKSVEQDLLGAKLVDARARRHHLE